LDTQAEFYYQKLLDTDSTTDATTGTDDYGKLFILIESSKSDIKTLLDDDETKLENDIIDEFTDI